MIYIIKKVLTALITLFLVSILCFLIFSVIRGDPASAAGGIGITQEQLQILRGNMGLNRNIFVRYFDWLINFLSGNPGTSLYFRGEPVAALISQRLPVTLTLALLSLVFTAIISFAVSILTVKKKGSVSDNIINFLTAAALSTPGFFTGLLLIFIFGFTFKLFLPGEYIDYTENPAGFLQCLIPAAFAIAIPNSAILIKFLRGSLFNELHSDYVRTARSKGAKWLYIMRCHVLRNACLPAVTISGMITAEIFSGSIIIEQVFSIHGMGKLLIAAISSRDYPLIQAIMIYTAFLVVCANTLADIINMIIDPRIKLTGKIR